MTIPKVQTGFGFKRGEKKIHKYDAWPVKLPSIGEVLIEVKAVGLCQSDLHILHAQESFVPDEFIMGHEIAGKIVKLGENVPDQYEIGQRVAVCIPNACGTCTFCRGGADNACSETRAAFGLHMDGGFQQYLLINNLKSLLPIPDEVSYEAAAVTSDAVLTPFHAIQRAKEQLSPSSKVLVMGVGGLGLNAIQILRHYGSQIVAVDLKEEARELALDYGASEFYSDLSLSDHDWESFDVCFDFCGFEQTIDTCITYVKKRGMIMPVGLGKFKLKIRHFELARKEVSMIYSFGGTSKEQMECMEWVAQGKIKPLSSTVPLSMLPEYLDLLGTGKIKGRAVFIPPHL